MWVLFEQNGIPGWFGPEPIAGTEWVEGVEASVLCSHRRTAKGKWVLRTPSPVVEPTEEERAAARLAEHEAALTARAEAVREALAREADPLFFQWQRGEATEADWLQAVAAVKSRHPKPAAY